MADLSFAVASPELEAELLAVVDVEGKIPAALDALGPVAGRDVTVLDAAGGYRSGQLAERGANVTACGGDPASLPAGSADVVVACWTSLDGPASPEIDQAERLLRPGGRLLLVQDYGRDDLCQLWPDAYARQLEWSSRTGPFLTSGFRIRVIHCRWTFGSLDAAGRILDAAFGQPGADLAARLRRPRLAYNIAIYHRSGSGAEADAPDLPGAAFQAPETAG